MSFDSKSLSALDLCTLSLELSRVTDHLTFDLFKLVVTHRVTQSLVFHLKELVPEFLVPLSQLRYFSLVVSFLSIGQYSILDVQVFRQLF